MAHLYPMPDLSQLTSEVARSILRSVRDRLSDDGVSLRQPDYLIVVGISGTLVPMCTIRLLAYFSFFQKYGDPP